MGRMNEENGLNKEDFDTKAPKEAEKVSFKEMLWDTVKFALISLIIVLPIRTFIAQPFLVHGASMNPTFADGDYLIVDQISYRFNKPERGDVIIFKYPKNPSKYFIKRIIGLPEETVTIKNRTVSVYSPFYGQINLAEEYIINKDILPRNIEVTLTDDEYFVMGDNRPASSDSREWGPLSKSFITGKVFVRLLPITDIGINPGQQ